jgi:dienelactone hydrolase
MKKILVVKLVVISLLMAPPLARAEECVPYNKESHQLIEIRPGYYTIKGDLARFDPCNSTVSLKMPSLFSEKISEKPPVFLIVHGGGGLGTNEKNLASALNSEGIAALVFDAYKMNGYVTKEEHALFLTGASNEARQRMIYKVSLGAYRWLKNNEKVDTSRIFIFGISNGATVAANLAAAVDVKHVRAVIAEGTTSLGLGLPHTINVPTRLVVGKLDNYGGATENDLIFTRTGPCYVNVLLRLAPPGTSETCSQQSNPHDTSISPQTWFENLKASGKDIDVWFYDNAAHGIMAGPIDRGVRIYGTGPTAKKRFGWTGSDSDAQEKFIADLKALVKSTY